MSKGRIAPMRPSIAKYLKRQIGGFVREYEREANRPPESPASEKPPATPEPKAGEKPDAEEPKPAA